VQTGYEGNFFYIFPSEPKVPCYALSNIKELMKKETNIMQQKTAAVDGLGRPVSLFLTAILPYTYNSFDFDPWLYTMEITT
jgi:hypothetical protein